MDNYNMSAAAAGGGGGGLTVKPVSKSIFAQLRYKAKHSRTQNLKQRRSDAARRGAETRKRRMTGRILASNTFVRAPPVRFTRSGRVTRRVTNVAAHEEAMRKQREAAYYIQQAAVHKLAQERAAARAAEAQATAALAAAQAAAAAPAVIAAHQQQLQEAAADVAENDAEIDALAAAFGMMGMLPATSHDQKMEGLLASFAAAKL
jgi:hypothetical protein